MPFFFISAIQRSITGCSILARSLAVSAADILVLSRALTEFYKSGTTALLDEYPASALGASGRRSASRGG